MRPQERAHRLCEFRLYEELNDYLPRERRKRSFTSPIGQARSVKDAIEALGVPHTEIDLILVDGRSVRFEHTLRGGERVAVYPVFERFDITPLHRLRPKPLREPRFVADVHLGALARYLRLLGFDTIYRNDLGNAELARLTAHRRRILLTRDVGLLKRKSVVRGHWLRSHDSEAQLAEVVRALQLQRMLRPFTRCMECNGRLRPISRAAVRGEVPDRVHRRFRAFLRCRQCRRVYWRGTHFKRLRRLVMAVRSGTAASGRTAADVDVSGGNQAALDSIQIIETEDRMVEKDGEAIRGTRRSEMRRAMIVTAGVVAVVAAVLAIIWAMQRRIMYFPASGVPAPSAIGLSDVEAVTFETMDGLSLSGWFFAVSGPSSPPVTVLVFNGNAGNRAHRGPLAAALRHHGFQVLLVDYRGYGGNPGAPSKDGLAADARAARTFLAGRPDVELSRLVYFGESLGTAVAVDLADEHPPSALVLRSPFTSMIDLGRYHYPFLPVGVLLRDRFAAIDQIRRIRVPLLVIAGAQDRIVPIDNTRRLYDAAMEPKTLLVLSDADHNDYELLAGVEMIQAIVRFLQPFN